MEAATTRCCGDVCLHTCAYENWSRVTSIPFMLFKTPHLCMAPIACRSSRTFSTTRGGCCNIVAMCSLVLLPSTKAKTCLCFRDQVFIILFSTCGALWNPLHQGRLRYL